MDDMKVTDLLIKELRNTIECLERSYSWSRRLKDSYKEQSEKTGGLILKSAANAEIALAEAYRLMTMIVTGEAEETWMEAYNEREKE